MYVIQSREECSLLSPYAEQIGAMPCVGLKSTDSLEAAAFESVQIASE